MHYKVSISNAADHFIKLEWSIGYVHQDILHLQLPAWRPGRYELQNYAKNVRRFEVCDAKGKPVSFTKITKDCWEVNAKGVKSLTVSYEYYANQLDAGASFVSEAFLYVNPVNCMMYVDGRMDESYAVTLDVPDDYKIACQLPLEGKTLHAKDFDQLADSPFIADPSMQHEEFTASGSKIHFWFSGRHGFDMERLKADTAAYVDAQVAMFGDMPSVDYHFLYIMMAQRFHHGVEHTDSTVIAMGQGDDMLDEDFYDEFISISSHELFHLWNVKRIRPADMLPYDFTKENYSTLGYIYEGVTTYYGDLILLRSGVWSWEQFAEKFNFQLKRHFDNEGRFSYSVAESSFDTWLDGYVPGVKGRKVSIYVEGMLAAYIADIMVIHHSKGKYSLDNVMHDLYQQFYQNGKGYTETGYQALLEKYAGVSFELYFKEVIRGKGMIENYLDVNLPLIKCVLQRGPKGITVENEGNEKDPVFARWAGSRS